MFAGNYFELSPVYPDVPTEDIEFFDPFAEDSRFEWQQAPGYPEGEASELVLYEDNDGRRTSFLKLQPGVETEEVLAHEYYEEVYIIGGGFIDKRLEAAFTAGMYACRTPGMEHGPYLAPVGALAIEFRYYE